MIASTPSVISRKSTNSRRFSDRVTFRSWNTSSRNGSPARISTMPTATVSTTEMNTSVRYCAVSVIESPAAGPVHRAYVA